MFHMFIYIYVTVVLTMFIPGLSDAVVRNEIEKMKSSGNPPIYIPYDTVY